ncbi:MAG: glycosyltransferase family 39 protein [Candidatus Levyibacteriota bacterium]|nr:MAG: glycosyltransferase family 39 protein [Candidatus Levybacteria bacterium]
MKKEHLILGVIIFFGIFLRFWHVSDIPPSLSHDEVAIGYNAYSLLKTGKDEYGSQFPLLFRSFDDYKLPGMVYSTVVSIALFGLNELGVRFPSAFFGSLTVIVFYFFIRNFYEKKNYFFILLPTFFFAFSIWHINFSRQLFESNGALFFLLCGAYFLFLFPQKPQKIVAAAFFLALSIYFYYSVRLVLPFILLAFLFIHKNILKQHFRYLLMAFFVGFFVLLPLFPSLFSNGGLSRISTVSVINDKNYLMLQKTFAQKSLQTQSPLSKFLYNRRVALFITAAENYFKNVSFQHIFLSGTGPLGLLYIVEAPFFFWGIYCLFKRKEKKKWLIFAWALSVPLAGAVTTDQPNALRTLLNAPIYSFISGLGLATFLSVFKKTEWKIVFLGIFVFSFLLSFLQFFQTYFYITPQKNSLHFGDGYKQMAAFVKANEKNYDRIYISGYYWRPYIFILFWDAYSPQRYQKKGSPSGFGKYSFGSASWDSSGIFFGDTKFDIKNLVAVNKRKTLFIFAPEEYAVHKDNFIELAMIDGKYAKDVFVASIAK